jgi:hypothetical protein
MPEAPKTTQVEPGSELGRLLDAVAETAILLEKEGVLYRLHRVDATAPVDGARRRRTRLEPERALNIIGLGAAESGSDVARLKDRYVADAADPRVTSEPPADVE